MKIRILKKNNKSLFAKRNKGFYGRVFVLGVDDHHVVLQHIKGKPKTHAVLTYCDTDLFQGVSNGELLIQAIQRHYLKKYKHELLFVKSFVSLPQFSERDGAHWLELQPVSKQKSIDFGEGTGRFGTSAQHTSGREGVPGLDTGGAGGKGGNVKAKPLRNRKRLAEANQEDSVIAVRQLALAID